MEKMKRTHTCGKLNKQNIKATVTLNGWVHRNRNHGGIHFVNLRDHYGITQVVIDQDAPDELKDKARDLKFEYCIAVTGVVRMRPDEMINKEMATGEIEVKANEIEILSKSDVLPFMIDDVTDAREELRLKYRFLDLRSFSMQRKIKLRADVTFAVREFLRSKNFLEIETPTLIKPTPEGARDFLVPARLQPGKFYALPQSPQLLKQILMVSGMDKYFQIARCYRDEDARGDRQLEFTQIDIEMSFVSQDDVFKITEDMMAYLFKKTMGITLKVPFNRIPYEESYKLYGTDKPDLRFEMKLNDFSIYVPGGSFQVFKTVLESKGAVTALVAQNCAHYSRKMITDLEETAKTYGAKGLAWMKVTENGLDGGISKFYSDQSAEICSGLEAKKGDLILLIGDDRITSLTAMGAVRTRLGADLGLTDKKIFNFCWITDFPLFEWNKDENKWDPAHHMFTMPKDKYIDTLEKDPGAVKGDVYDLVCNGNELASGSIRIHYPELQKRIFNIVGFSEKEAQERFGFLINSFKYGAPPHGGIAPGLDRLVMLMAGEDTIREVIPFPKNTAGISPMDGSPSVVSKEQLDELHVQLNIPEDLK